MALEVRFKYTPLDVLICLLPSKGNLGTSSSGSCLGHEALSTDTAAPWTGCAAPLLLFLKGLHLPLSEKAGATNPVCKPYKWHLGREVGMGEEEGSAHISYLETYWVSNCSYPKQNDFLVFR